MKIELTNVTDGRYGLAANDKLYFQFENNNDLIIDKKSGLAIAYTLIDSLNLLDDYAEELLYKIEDILNDKNK